ncbi:MAG: response regulator, partial [Chitinivibrionales bacterium]
EKDVAGKTSLELNIWKNPNDRETVVEALKKHGRIDNFETQFMTKNGNIVDGLMSAAIIEIDGITHILNISRDVTERKKAEKKQKQLEEQLRQSQKLEAIGQLSSGVAHDFNNLLGGIMGHAELLKLHLSEGSDLLRHAAGIISSCVKAADLTKQLLTFARKAPVEFKKIDVNSFIKEAAGIMERTIDRRVEIAVTIQKEPLFISGDRNQLENALLNIAINARDAMPEGGKLSIISETMDLDKNALANGHFEVVEGTYIRIIVEDTGTGMSKAIKDRIFEPFFTTKDVGKGTGLGLASVYGCVKQHNGYITVDSHLGIGTQFNIYLPVIKSTGPVDGVKEESALNPGKGGLLVVDDEAVYGDILREIFGELGYTVHCCMNGAEAVAFYRERFSAIQVVILDMNMPKMNGLDCFRRLKEINANVKVIVSTGYGENKDRATMQSEGVRAFVQKPYRTAELANKIKELMAS